MACKSLFHTYRDGETHEAKHGEWWLYEEPHDDFDSRTLICRCARQ